jgi:flagellar assembly protein FliH
MQALHDSERERARADGYAAGMAEAKAAAAKELALTHQKFQVMVDSAMSAMELAHKAVLSTLQSSAGKVAFAAVCRLVGRKLASPEFLMGLVEHACAQLRTDVIATARLHPRDVNTLRDLMQGQDLKIRSLGLKVIPDDSLALGGCVIESASGRVDACLESQLRRLHAVLAAPDSRAERARDAEG